MRAYSGLAARYDELTLDVPYSQYADYYERVFAEYGVDASLVLDLCCGTGTLSCLLAERGYELISVDASADMLCVAQGKFYSLPDTVKRPMPVNQRAEELDLYGTVDAAVSSLDSFSYIEPELLPEVMRRLRLFVRPGGVAAFDMRTPEFLRSMDGSVSIDETDGVFCVWRGSFEENALRYGMDVFSRDGEVWSRDFEEHTEYAHEPERVERLLTDNGFTDVKIRSDAIPGMDGRVFFTARRE